MEYTLERVCDINAYTRRTVERTGEIATLVRDAFRFLRVFLIDTVTGLVRGIGTVR